MNSLAAILALALRIAAAVQMGIGLVNFACLLVIGWQGAWRAWPAPLREMFVVHLVFSGLIVLGIAGLTIRFAEEMAAGKHPAGRWLGGVAAIYWWSRAGLQLVYCWAGDPSISHLHLVLLIVYGGIGVPYLLVVLRAFPATGHAD